jgi:hypothetical protein
MSQNHPKRHVDTPAGVLCGSRSFAASMRVANCGKCNARIEEMLTLLRAVKEEVPGAVKKVRKFLAKIGAE